MARSTTSTRPPGRPRSGVDAAVFAATLATVHELGYAHATVDRIAAAAGVAKTTVYRRADGRPRRRRPRRHGPTCPLTPCASPPCASPPPAELSGGEAELGVADQLLGRSARPAVAAGSRRCRVGRVHRRCRRSGCLS